jgi:hypothetical protein
MDIKYYRQHMLQVKPCPQPIFLMGCPRSGTTGLAAALGLHSQLVMLGESEILFPLFQQDPVTKVVEAAKGRLVPNWLVKYDVDPAEVLAYLGLGINAFFTSKNPGKRWIDKTPHHVLMADILANMFPDALFLHLIRDGRRVVHSMVHFLDRFPAERREALFQKKQLPPWATDFQDACQRWRRFMEVGKAFASKRPRRCLTIRNENLAINPDGEFASIFHFLEVPEEKGPVDFFRTHRLNSSFPQSLPELASEQGGIRQDKPESFVENVAYTDQQPWQEWDVKQKKIFAQEAGETLVRFGFAPPEELLGWGVGLNRPNLRETVMAAIPFTSSLLVVSDGDKECLKGLGRKAEPFPQGPDGCYARPPATGGEAMAHLQALLAQKRDLTSGGKFLLFPPLAFRWLDRYPEFREHLDSHYHRTSENAQGIAYQLWDGPKHRPVRASGSATSKFQGQGPVVIGGVNGSGTRVVAKLLMDLGFYLGSELNEANDNLLMAYLFMGFRQSGASPEALAAGRDDSIHQRLISALKVIQKVMVEGGGLIPGERHFLIDLASPRFNSALEAKDFVDGVLAHASWIDYSGYTGWGWKAPASHIMIPYLSECFPQAQYIHVIRHGLDMAYSTDSVQFQRWSSFFGVPLPPTPELMPKAMLAYWTRANERAISLGTSLLGNRFLVINFDNLCASPQNAVAKLAEFVGIRLASPQLDSVASIVKKPTTTGRYRTRDLGIFNEADFEAVRKLGFGVD